MNIIHKSYPLLLLQQVRYLHHRDPSNQDQGK